MNTDDILAEFEASGSERLRAQNARHGVDQPQFGVKMGDIRAMAKRIKKNHPLAIDLWSSGYFESQMLALLILNPRELTVEDMDGMVQSIRSPQVADWFGTNVSKKHPDKEQARQIWMVSDHSWALRAGWSLTAERIAKDADGLNLEALLERIATEMPTASPQVQWMMNTALAFVGIHHAALREQAVTLGERMGIYRDYPTPKGCTSPFAPIWIAEMVRRQAV